MRIGAVATPIQIADAFDDPDEIRRLVERNGPYRSVASYLPASATRGSQDTSGSESTLPWFRGNWAVNGRASVEGADAILQNPRFVRAASQMFGTRDIVPSTVVVNVNAPMPAGAVHVDIPSFRGANRDEYPLRLLQAMGTSGLFDRWRVVEAGAVCWFYDGPGGAYDYWPEGLDGPMRSERPPFINVALVADNNRMYHRIGWIGDQAASLPQLSHTAEMRHRESGDWIIIDADRERASYPDEQVRISILWKARVHRDRASDALVGDLTPDRVVEVITADLRARGLDPPDSSAPFLDDAWIDLVHTIYYPVVTVDD